MRIPILGGTRFIGWHIASALKKEGHIGHTLTFLPSIHNIYSYSMNISELERRLGLFLTEHSAEWFKVSGGSAAGFRVELALKPNTPITERFIRGLETALRSEIGSLSVLRMRHNVFIVRLTLRPIYHEDSPETDRFEECPSPYGASQWSLSTIGEAVTV
jgi:hypothetical protein